jgi:hypothetical protein
MPFRFRLNVTSLDVNFRYPDQMSQAKFVPVAKMFLPCGLNFLLIFPSLLLGGNGKTLN